MPLSKARDAERKRLARRVQPESNLADDGNVQPNSNSVRPSKVKIPGLVIEGNQIIGVDKRLDIDEVQPELPICNEYNFRQFKAGDRVRVKRGGRFVETVVPELDAEGNPIWR